MFITWTVARFLNTSRGDPAAIEKSQMQPMSSFCLLRSVLAHIGHMMDIILSTAMAVNVVTDEVTTVTGIGRKKSYMDMIIKVGCKKFKLWFRIWPFLIF